MSALPTSSWMLKPRSKITDDAGNATSSGAGVFGFFRGVGSDKWEKRHVSAARGDAIMYGKTLDNKDKKIKFDSIRAVRAVSKDQMLEAKCPPSHATKGWVLTTSEGKEILWAVCEASGGETIRDEWVDFLQEIVMQRQPTTMSGFRNGNANNPSSSKAKSKNDDDDDNSDEDEGNVQQPKGPANNSAAIRSANTTSHDETAAGADDADEDGGAVMNKKSQRELDRLAGGRLDEDEDDLDISEYLNKTQNTNDDDYDDDYSDDEDLNKTARGGGKGVGGSANIDNSFGGEDGVDAPVFESKEQQYKKLLMPIAIRGTDYTSPSAFENNKNNYLYLGRDRLKNYKSHLLAGDSVGKAITDEATGSINIVGNTVRFARFMIKIAKKDNFHERDVLITDRRLYLFAKGSFGRILPRIIEIDQIVGVIESTTDPSLFAIIVPSFHDIFLKVTVGSHQINNDPDGLTEVDVKRQMIAHLYCSHLRLVKNRDFIFRDAENVAAVIRRTEDDQHLPLLSKQDDYLRIASNKDLYPALRTNADTIVYFSCYCDRLNQAKEVRKRGFVLTDNAIYTVSEKLDDIARRTGLSEINKAMFNMIDLQVLFKGGDTDTLLTLKSEHDLMRLMELTESVTQKAGRKLEFTPSANLFNHAQLVANAKILKMVTPDMDKAKIRKMFRKLGATSASGVGLLGTGVKTVGGLGFQAVKTVGKGVGGVMIDNAIAGEFIGMLSAAGNAMANSERFIYETILTLEDEEAALAAPKPFPDRLHLARSDSSVASHSLGEIYFSSRCKTYNLLSSHIDTEKTEHRIVTVSRNGGLHLFVPSDSNDWRMFKNLFSNNKGLEIDIKLEFSAINGIVTCESEPTVVGLLTSRHCDLLIRLPNEASAAQFVRYLAHAATRFSGNTGAGNTSNNTKQASSATSGDVIPPAFTRSMCPIYSVERTVGMKLVLKKTLIDPPPVIACRCNPQSDSLLLSRVPQIVSVCRRYGDNTIHFSGMAWRFRNSTARKGTDKMTNSLESAQNSDERKHFKSFVLILTNAAIYVVTKGGYNVTRRIPLRRIRLITLSSEDPDAVLFEVPKEFDALFRIEGRRKEFLDRLQEAYLGNWSDFGWYKPGEVVGSHTVANYFIGVTQRADIVNGYRLAPPKDWETQQAAISPAKIANANRFYFEEDLRKANQAYKSAVYTASTYLHNLSRRQQGGGLSAPHNQGGGGGHFIELTWEQLWTNIVTAASRLKFCYCRAYVYGIRPNTLPPATPPAPEDDDADEDSSNNNAFSSGTGRLGAGPKGGTNTASNIFTASAANIAPSPLDQQPMALCGQRMADFSRLSDFVQQLSRALAAEDVERYRRVVKRVKDDNNGRTELVLSKLLKEQEATVGRLEIKQRAVDEIQHILEGGDRIGAHRERLTNLIEAAIAVQVSHEEISRLLKQIDAKLQAERMDTYLNDFADSVEGKGWTQTERRTLIDTCSDLGLMVGPQTRTFKSIKGKLRGSCEAVDTIIEALHYAIASGIGAQLEETIVGTRQQLSEAVAAGSSPNNIQANKRRQSAAVGRTDSSLSMHPTTAMLVAAPAPRLRLTSSDIQLIESEIAAAEIELKTLQQAEQAIFDLDRLRASVPVHRLYSYSVAQLRSEAQNYERIQTILLGFATGTEGTIANKKSANLQQQQRCRAAMQIHLDICQLQLDRISEIVSSKLEEEEWRKKEQQAQKEFRKHVESTQAEVRQIQAASELQRQLEQHTRLENDVTSWAAQADDIYRMVQKAVASSSNTNTKGNGSSNSNNSLANGVNIDQLRTLVRSANAILDNLVSALRVYSPGYEDNTKIPSTIPDKLKYRMISVTSTIGHIRSQLSTAIKFADRFIEAHNNRIAANGAQDDDHKNVIAIPPAIQRAIDLLDQPALIDLIKKHSLATLAKSKADAVSNSNKNADNKSDSTSLNSTMVSLTPTAPEIKPLNLATLNEIKRQWAARAAQKAWVESLHKSLAIATSLGNAPLLKVHLDRAAEKHYTDDIVRIAHGRYSEMVKVKEPESGIKPAGEGTTSAPSASGMVTTPAARSRANSQQDAKSPNPRIPSVATETDNTKPTTQCVTYRKPLVIPLEHPYDPQSPSASDRIVAELLLGTMMMLRDCSNKPTEAAIIMKPGESETSYSATSGAKLIIVPESTPEVKAVVNAWVTAIEHMVKPSGIFKKVPRTLFDIMKVLGEAELPHSKGTLAAPYTNRLVQDFDRIKEWNSPQGATASYFLMSYILYRGCLVAVLTELLLSVPPKARHELFAEGALLREERCFKDLISIGHMCEQVQWSFKFNESSSVAIQQRKAAAVAATASPQNQNSSLSLARTEAATQPSTSPANNHQVSAPSATPTVEDNEVPLGISANIVVSGLRQAIKIFGDYYYESLAKLGTKPSPEEAAKLLDERLHKGIGLVVRNSICPAIAAALLVGYRSKSFMNKRYLWDFVVAAGAKLKESMRDLQAMAIPDGIDLILNITDPDGRNKVFLHRLSDEQIASLRFRMFVCHLLNTNSLAAFLSTVYSEDCAQSVQAAIYQNPALTGPIQAAAASVARDMMEDEDDSARDQKAISETVSRTVSRALLNTTTPLKETPVSLVTAIATRTSKDQLNLLHKYYHLDRCLLLCMHDSRTELLKLAATFSKLKFLLCIDAEVW